MSNQLCPCATECEWLPEHYQLEHHPDCQNQWRYSEPSPQLYGLLGPREIMKPSAHKDAVDDLWLGYEYPPSHYGSVTFKFPIDDARVFLFLNEDDGELNLTSGEVEMRCHWTKLSQSLTGTVSKTFARFELSFRILDVLSPPAAREKWLQEKGK